MTEPSETPKRLAPLEQHRRDLTVRLRQFANKFEIEMPSPAHGLMTSGAEAIEELTADLAREREAHQQTEQRYRGKDQALIDANVAHVKLRKELLAEQAAHARTREELAAEKVDHDETLHTMTVNLSAAMDERDSAQAALAAERERARAYRAWLAAKDHVPEIAEALAQFDTIYGT